MKKRQVAIDEAYEALWDGGKGSHHPDYDPLAVGDDVKKATRETEELLAAIVKARGRAPRPPASALVDCEARPLLQSTSLIPPLSPTRRRRRLGRTTFASATKRLRRVQM